MCARGRGGERRRAESEGERPREAVVGVVRDLHVTASFRGVEGLRRASSRAVNSRSTPGLLAFRPAVGSLNGGNAAPRADSRCNSATGRSSWARASSGRCSAMLALQAGRTVSADRLVEGLWGEEPPSSAPKMVQLYVSQLRRLLDGDGDEIVTRGRGYELQLPDDDVDAARFEQLVDERARRARRLPCGAATPLADVADEPFAAAEIRRLEELRLRAHELAIDADLAAGRHAEVIAELEALVAQHPLRERLHAQRMLALYRSERQSEALDAYRQARARARGARSASSPGRSCGGSTSAILAQDPALDLAPHRRARPPATQPARPRRRRRRTALLPAAAALAAAAGVCSPSASAASSRRRPVPRHRRELRRRDRPGGRPHQRRSTRSAGARRRSSRAAARSGSRTRLDGTVSRIDRERQPDRDDRGRRRADRRSHSAPARCGSPTASRARSPRSTPARTGSCSDSRSATRRADRRAAPRARSGWPPASTARVRRIDLEPRTGATSSIPIGAQPDRDRGRRRRDLGGERGGRHGHPHRPAHRRGRQGDPRRQRAERRRGGRGRGVGRQPSRRDGVADRPRRNAVTGRSSVGGDPAAVAAGAGGVWVAGGAGTVTRVDPDTPRVIERIEVESSAGGASRSPTGRCGRPRSPRRERTAAARSGSSPGSAARDGRDRLAAPVRLRGDVVPAHLAGLRRARRLPAHRRRRRGDAGRRAGHRRPGTQPRRADLRLHAPAGAALLGRHARAA